MKVTCVSILLICVIAASFSNWLVIASFKINEAYIARQLCVNRNIPNSTCNGHCYLRKQLNKEETPGGTNSAGSKEKFEVQLFFVDASTENITGALPQEPSYHSTQQFTKQIVLRSFFHPPSI